MKYCEASPAVYIVCPEATTERQLSNSKQVCKCAFHTAVDCVWPFSNNGCQLDITRHTASTSMYSLTFCVRFLLPERHQRKPAVQAAAVMLRTPPSTANHRRASHAHALPIYGAQFWECSHHPPVSGQQRAQTPPSRPFALCRHIAGWTQACN